MTENPTQTHKNMKTSLYADLIAAGVPVSNHESDLYFPDTPEALRILDLYPLEKRNSKRFKNQRPPNVGELWVDVPFAFIPFWERVSARSSR
jgi:hypothetical protein